MSGAIISESSDLSEPLFPHFYSREQLLSQITTESVFRKLYGAEQ